MPARRLQFSLAMMLLAMLVVAIAVAIGRPWLPGYRDPNVLPWRKYSPELVARLRQEDKPILAFFSADWDMTAQAQLINVVNTREVKVAVKEHGYVPILVDCTDRISAGWPISKDWTELQPLKLEYRYPTTIVIPNDGTSVAILYGVYSKEELISAINGERSD